MGRKIRLSLILFLHNKFQGIARMSSMIQRGRSTAILAGADISGTLEDFSRWSK